MSEFKTGNKVMVRKSISGDYEGKATIDYFKNGLYTIIPHETHCGMRVINSIAPKRITLINQANHNNNITIGGTMNRIIVKLFPKTEEAVLVETHLGNSFSNALSGIWSKGLEGDILALANKMEKEEQEKNNK